MINKLLIMNNIQIKFNPSTSSTFSTLLLVFLLASCQPKTFHIYSDKSYGERVEQRFAEKRALAVNRDQELFSVLNQELTVTEQEGLKFLFAFMPLSDLADYSGDFFLKQVRWSLASRDTFPWGQTIPEEVFRHFVLPCRVNNENLDTARIVFFNELKDRIRNKSMLEAALEVNHWCHEKVTYRGSDSRTSTPLASMKTAYGRCGEESTFAVTALRSVSIPARQVYTPRWAHSDDNHAWVEFWAGGQWHYMGACEPECVPDLGWFTEPARRAMLIHTKAFGNYLGTERVENDEPNYALLNTLNVYAPVKEIRVRVIRLDEKPVEGSTVEFQLYNYAEFYPISVKQTDENGDCSLVTGLGELLVWARQGNDFGFRKISVAATDTISIILDQAPYHEKYVEYDMVPPIERQPQSIANDCREENNRLLRIEDSLRGAYETTFMTEAQAGLLAAGLGLPNDKVWDAIRKSRGNYREIETFLNAANPQDLPTAMDLLEVIAEKDLRDTRSFILLDHLTHALDRVPDSSGMTPETFTSCVLNPRVANEMLIAYRGYLKEAFGSRFAGEVRANPGKLQGWIMENIRINNSENYYSNPLTPAGVYSLRVADEHSRKIFAVAVLRTLGIPARLRPGTLEPEYWQQGHWSVMYFSKTDAAGAATGQPATLILRNDPVNPLVPQYETHYTLAHFANGKYNTLTYGYDSPGDLLKAPLELDPGYYLLVTGNRQPGGKVLSSLTYFELKPGETREMAVTLRKSDLIEQVLAAVKPDWEANTLNGSDFVWPELTGGTHLVIAWIEPDKEPTKHVFQDLGNLKVEVDKLGCPFVFLVQKDRMPPGFSEDTWKNLPSKSSFGVLSGSGSLQELGQSVGKDLSGQFPVVIVTDAEGQVIYLSSGYKIGIGEELVKMLSQSGVR